ncbi:hypothetical protein OsI_32202 [Oryza sativa Indica Group]|uniref:Uncharacterized protein n=1 Tax=Oryza sativa subsp. indica TaxID=39946 RepID=B8BDX7_ORYSI|nr:hypothetical protein OsI_32202 [Oryza sativa Indica Group]
MPESRRAARADAAQTAERARAAAAAAVAASRSTAACRKVFSDAELIAVQQQAPLVGAMQLVDGIKMLLNDYWPAAAAVAGNGMAAAPSSTRLSADHYVLRKVRDEEGREERKREDADVATLTCGAHVGPTLSQLPHRIKPESKPLRASVMIDVTTTSKFIHIIHS